MDGVFLSPSEDEFVGRIVEELEHFLEQGQHHRVLLFPPLSSRLRYLIHRTVESMELLSSFSVGEGWRRRTVICHSAVRLPTETSSEQRAGTAPARAQRPAQPWGRGGRGARPRHPGDTHGDSPRATVGSGRITRPPRRKPERALYVPRGSRKKENWRERESPGDGAAAPGGENCPRNSSREQQDQGRAGGGPGKQQEPEGGPGKGSAGNVPPLGNGSGSWEQQGRGGDCAQCPGSAHGKQPPEAGQQLSQGSAIVLSPGSAIDPGQEPSPGSAIDPGQEELSPGSAIVLSPGSAIVLSPGSAIDLSPGSAIDPEQKPSPGSAIDPGQEPSQGSAINPGQEELSPGSAIDPGQELSPGSAIDPGQELSPGSAIVLSPGSAIVPEGSELQELQEEKESSRDPGGAECGRSSVPLENQGGSRTALPVPAPAVPAPAVPAPGVTDLLVTNPAVTDPAMTDQPVPAPAVPAPPALPSQPPQSSQAPRAQQDSQAVPTQGSPSAGQVELKPPQKVLEGPAEALAASELLPGGDPGRIHGGKEEEEEEEGSGVAEALRRGQDVAAGDREGTRQSGLEDDCTAELLAEIVGNLTVKEISVERISVDGSGCGEGQLSQGHLGHVTEIYDFAPSLRTEDLLGIFSEFHLAGPGPALPLPEAAAAAPRQPPGQAQGPAETQAAAGGQGEAADGLGRGQENRVPRPGLEAAAAGAPRQ
ncbi:R3H and coiled-coil domain-containing protein 1 isoform X2 [Serinus canaria]|uniref:R3H and coiled-coil domain-containing protein 1 isoform X2 n=1 Tax=Serinus canaria TaxID=9135 RepID=UPI0021CCB8A9|nr:R3H and coiled-coil domain-containing protein 1 isoform X2 [Serinus canaria]